jgi:membrane fusion protein (multidrug efflux system)
LSQEPQKNKSKRNRILFLLALLFLASGGGYYYYYDTYAKFYEDTDNAYIGQNIVYVTPQTSGNIDAIYVSEMQSVKAGDKIAHIDSHDAQLAFLSAKAALAQSVRAIKQTQMQKEEARNAIALAEVNVDKAKDDLKRNSFLLSKGAITEERFANLEFAKDAADASLAMANKKLLSFDVLLKDKAIANNPEVQSAILRVEKTYLDLKRCDIIAPADGLIAKKNLSIGQSVTNNTTLLSIVPQKGFWVDANFKETQLEHIRINQDVTLTSDLYGKDVIFHGKVLGISAGTGAVFSLLPAQNASGNWIKIVQRVPVRIALNQNELQKHPLQVGNSMDATVDLHKQDGGFLRQITSPAEVSAIDSMYDKAQNELKTIIKSTIEQNL